MLVVVRHVCGGSLDVPPLGWLVWGCVQVRASCHLRLVHHGHALGSGWDGGWVGWRCMAVGFGWDGGWVGW